MAERRFRGDGGSRLPECERCADAVQEVYEERHPTEDAIDFTVYCHGQKLRLAMSSERVMRYRQESRQHPLYCEFRVLRFPRGDGSLNHLEELSRLTQEILAKQRMIAEPRIFIDKNAVVNPVKGVGTIYEYPKDPPDPPPHLCRECMIIDGSNAGPLRFTIQYKHKGCLEALKKEVAKRNEERERVRFLAQKAEMRLAAEAGDSAVARAPAAPRRGVVIYCQNDEDVP